MSTLLKGALVFLLGYVVGGVAVVTWSVYQVIEDIEAD